jgi:hypothetical protein
MDRLLRERYYLLRQGGHEGESAAAFDAFANKPRTGFVGWTTRYRAIATGPDNAGGGSAGHESRSNVT